jgi:hypothetical protein
VGGVLFVIITSCLLTPPPQSSVARRRVVVQNGGGEVVMVRVDCYHFTHSVLHKNHDFSNPSPRSLVSLVSLPLVQDGVRSTEDLHLGDIPRIVRLVRSEGEVVVGVRVATGAEHQVRGDADGIGSVFERATKGHVVHSAVSKLMEGCAPKIGLRLQKLHGESVSSEGGDRRGRGGDMQGG